MAKRMLVDATHPEETRVVVVSGNRLDELDFEIATRKQLKGNIYLAKVIRVEPSLQAAFVEYGGNRHGFLAFSEIHPDYYRIPVADREALMREYERAAREHEDAHHPLDRAEAEADAEGGVEETPTDTPVDEIGGNAPPLEAGTDEAAPVAGPEGESPLTAAEEQATEAAETAPAEKPKRSRSRSAKGAGTAKAAKPAKGDAAAEEAPATMPAADEEAAAVPAKKARPSRSRKAKGASPEAEGADSAAAEASSADAAPEAGEQGEKAPAKPRRKRTPKAQAMANESVETVEEEVEETRTGRPRPHRPLKSYKIQEVIKRRQIMLVQVTKEERGNKGAALTTYLSLPGRYCVLMPNTPRGGGISRKITNPADRKRLKELLEGLDIPDGMSVILRTAGIERSKQEIKRDLEYLMRLWDDIREQTLQSVAPALIYEEANLIKRSIRDLYAQDVDDILVEGDEGYRTAKDFMRMLMPSHTKKVQRYDDDIPLFHRFQVEGQIETMFNPVVQLKSGGYIVINQTEALVAIDVNSGRSTKERNIEETALKTNLEAADEVARQLRLRDLAGLIVIDFIDMEEGRNNAAVEKRLKEAMKADRARIQLGRISPFGLLELSRQRLRPSLQEINFERCPHCAGTGMVRSIESAALAVLRAIEEEGIRRRSSEITVTAATSIALYILNQKRDALAIMELKYGLRVFMHADDSLTPPEHRLERIRARQPDDVAAAPVSAERIFAETDRALEAQDADTAEELDEDENDEADDTGTESASPDAPQGQTGNGDRGEGGRRRRRRRRRRGGNGEGRGEGFEITLPQSAAEEQSAGQDLDDEGDDEDEGDEAETGAQAHDGNGENGEGRKKRRRGKRGGRRRARQREDGSEQQADADEAATEDDTGMPTAVEAVTVEAPVETLSDAVDAAAQETPAAEEAEEAEAPKKRGSRSRRKADAEPVAEEAPKKKPARGRRKADAEPAAEPAADEAADQPAATAPAPVEAPAAPTPEAAAAAEPANPYIEVNPPVEKPKKGWWSRPTKG